LANILILSRDLPYPLHWGNTLRMFHPCREMAKRHTCTLVTFGDQTPYVQELRDQKVFNEITVIPEASKKPSFKRHFRGSDLNFMKLSSPDFYKATVRVLEDKVQRHHIDVVISWPSILTEFVTPLRNVRKIADSCDCITLTQERQFRHYRQHLSLKQRGKAWIALQRSKRFEKILPLKHDFIVSISPVDQQRLISLNTGQRHKIMLIPNGIPRELLSYQSKTPELDNAIVFWGNLQFPPNHSAIVYFYEQVYVPYLRGKNIKWYIVGRNADERIRKIVLPEALTAYPGRYWDNNAALTLRCAVPRTTGRFVAISNPSAVMLPSARPREWPWSFSTAFSSASLELLPAR